ncbi:TGF-beta receptor type-1 [Echinococcus granulosus]|uniref:receptor protein serine/threonine kinase n=1 Tax=Echinococcus granulosus TaxID=6210 RepID=W6UDN2_ECHGR|nr:TGF-beta receptor type-1 [Echinococcus granulosus]EUB59148.1 TGF-beta receptor type-1 [Echinococcus granulosus]
MRVSLTSCKQLGVVNHEPPDSLYGVYLPDLLTTLETKDSKLFPDMFALSLLLLFSAAKPSIANRKECLKLLCNPDESDCHPCTGMSVDELGTWRRYIDALLQNFNDEESNNAYYRQIREEPFCCTISPGERCIIKLINEPNVPPHRLYEMGCLRQKDFWKPFSCESANMRCCNSSFCNLPLKEELSKLIVEVPKDNTLIVILSIFLVLAVLMLVAGWCFWRCRGKAASQAPVSMIGAGCIGDATGHTSPSDTHPWHMVECGASGASMVSAIPTATTAANASAVAVNGGVLNATAANSGVSVATTLIDSVPLHPSRTPFLMASSSISSVVAVRPPRGLGAIPTGVSSYHNSIGGSTVVRGSEVVGLGGGGASYTAASGGASMLPASCSAPPGAGGTLEITLSGSGSGAGQPLLVERTVARQVTLSARIGEGRYGEVWLGRLHGDQVAVKIFSSRNENSWIREKEIYETATLRHSNILGFIAADNKDNGISTELWLIAEYHRLGSLYEFLQSHAFTLPALIKMASSIANGLAHLHMAIVGTSKLLSDMCAFFFSKGKPPIAHRDLKSRNILVKADGECCIGDLGFAVKYDSLTGSVDIGHNTERIGTKRYMAPEVLDNTLYAHSFDAYMQADIYSLGLVFWEMTRRVYVANLYGPEEYQLPYQDNVGPDPLIEEMKSVVCELGIRPHLPLVWQTDASLRLLYHIMTECWFANPSHRLSAMRIKKDLANQRQQLGSPRQPGETPLPPHILRQQPSSLDALPPGLFVYRSVEAASAASNANTSTLETNQVGEAEVEAEQALLASGGPTIQPPNVVATAAVQTDGALVVVDWAAATRRPLRVISAGSPRKI